METDNTILFLNLLLIKNQYNTIGTNYYRKNTCTGRYLNNFSNHPVQQKIAIIKNFVDTALLLLHEKFHAEKVETIKNLLLRNRL